MRGTYHKIVIVHPSWYSLAYWRKIAKLAAY